MKRYTDKQRLDWLAQNDAVFKGFGPNAHWTFRYENGNEIQGLTLRDTIDEAINHEKKT